MVNHNRAPTLIGEFLYGSLFVVVIPLLLVQWSMLLEPSIRWPVPEWRALGAVVGLLGLAMITQAMRDLYVYGQGLPMNAYPPRRFVTRGLYAWFAHPIYVGAVICSAGISLWFQSSSGLYVITPVLAFMTMALVYGYERLAMQKRFGPCIGQHHPVFSLPGDQAARAAWPRRMAMVVRIILPWLVAGYLIDYARCAGRCTGAFMEWFDMQQVHDGWAIAWAVPYLYLVIKLLAARTAKDLLHAMIVGTIATVSGLILYLVAPAFGVDLINSRVLLTLVAVFTLVGARAYQTVWRCLQKICEWVANSRRDWLFFDGQFRIISHVVFSFLSGAIAAGLGSYVLGNAVAVFVMIAGGLLGAALYAQLSWGSSMLQRPLGYWGGLVGVVLGSFVACVFLHIGLSQLMLAAVLAAPFAQIAGRLKCLVQGCCHGIVTDQRFGIRVWQPQSRVCLLSGLKGQWILITQLYSIVFNLLLGILLWAMWMSRSVPISLIVGSYAILTGIERFAEDGYRGETQTRVIRGLKESQWMAVLGVLVGVICTVLPFSFTSSPNVSLDLPFLGTVLIGGFLTAFVMSMDFPKSTLRFSRLSG